LGWDRVTRRPRGRREWWGRPRQLAVPRGLRIPAHHGPGGLPLRPAARHLVLWARVERAGVASGGLCVRAGDQGAPGPRLHADAGPELDARSRHLEQILDVRARAAIDALHLGIRGLDDVVLIRSVRAAPMAEAKVSGREL